MSPHAIDRIGTWQVTLTSAATQLAPKNQNRISLTLTKHGNQDFFYGCDATVTTSSGAILSGACGSYISIPTTDSVFGILSGGSLVVSVTEQRDA